MQYRDWKIVSLAEYQVSILIYFILCILRERERETDRQTERMEWKDDVCRKIGDSERQKNQPNKTKQGEMVKELRRPVVR